MFLIWWLITSAVDWEYWKGRSAPWDQHVHSVSESDPKVLRNTKSRYWSALIFKTKSYTTAWSLVRQICLLHPMLWSVIWIVISTRRSGGVQNKMETTIFPHPCKMCVFSQCLVITAQSPIYEPTVPLTPNKKLHPETRLYRYVQDVGWWLSLLVSAVLSLFPWKVSDCVTSQDDTSRKKIRWLNQKSLYKL